MWRGCQCVLIPILSLLSIVKAISPLGCVVSVLQIFFQSGNILGWPQQHLPTAAHEQPTMCPYKSVSLIEWFESNTKNQCICCKKFFEKRQAGASKLELAVINTAIIGVAGGLLAGIRVKCKVAIIGPAIENCVACGKRVGYNTSIVQSKAVAISI